MARTRYLAGTSVFAGLTKPAVVVAFAPLAASRQVALSRPVTFELGNAAREVAEQRNVTTSAITRRWVEAGVAQDGADVGDRAVPVQALL